MLTYGPPTRFFHSFKKEQANFNFHYEKRLEALENLVKGPLSLHFYLKIHG